jgi:peptidoglycan/xylan/chitin deacetylase (PgdA/CDA1 family)
MKGCFIVSLDCEGKWGMADKLRPEHHRLFNEDSLGRVYDELVSLFNRNDVPATFAFVMAFVLNEAERERFAHLFEVDDSKSGGWLSHFRAARQAGKLAGWFAPHALDAVRAHPQHEIACHGFCHRPLGDDALSAEEARAELAAAQEIATLKGLSLQTFVYPRNVVGHVQALSETHYIGYRAQRPRPPGRLGRIGSLAEELYLWPEPEVQVRQPKGEIVRIPAGFFFNWRFGARRFIPPTVTVRRWKTLLDRAARNGGVAHLWLHPHNLLTGPETRETLEAVLAYAARLAAGGHIELLTQQAYCRRVLEERGHP